MARGGPTIMYESYFGFAENPFRLTPIRTTST
jgi:hypothetical protein